MRTTSAITRRHAMKFLLLVTALMVTATPTLAGRELELLLCIKSVFITDYGDVRIYGGGDSGRLEFQRSDGTWGTVCNRGFDDDAGDVACKQLGYRRSTDILDSNQ